MFAKVRITAVMSQVEYKEAPRVSLSLARRMWYERYLVQENQNELLEIVDLHKSIY